MTASSVATVSNRAEQADHQVNQIINDIQKALNVKTNPSRTQNAHALIAQATDAHKK